MANLQNLIEKGIQLLKQIEPIVQNDILPSDVAAEIKSLHVQGRFLLRKIDRITYREYNSLFSKEISISDIYNFQSHNNYIRTELEKCVGILKAVQDAGVEDALDKSSTKIFISHGKFTNEFSKFEGFVRALGCIPVYDTEEPTRGATINEHVESLFRQADFYVILAKHETTNEKGIKLPNHNVIIEYDRLVQTHTDNILVLLEEVCKMPSMLQDQIYVTFSERSMEMAFTKFVSELRKQGLL